MITPGQTVKFSIFLRNPTTLAPQNIDANTTITGKVIFDSVTSATAVTFSPDGTGLVGKYDGTFIVDNNQTIPSRVQVLASNVTVANQTESFIVFDDTVDATVSSRMSTFTLPTNFASLSIDTSGKILLQPTQTGVTIPTVTTLTNLPAIPANWLTAAGIEAGALAGKGDWNTTTPPTAAAIAATLWTDLLAGSDFGTAGSVGALIKTNIGAMTFDASNNVKSYLNAVNPGILQNVATNADGTVQATDTDGSRLANAATQTTIATNTTQLPNLVTGTGVNAQFTAKALSLAPTGSGGSGGFTGAEQCTLTFKDAAGNAVPNVVFSVAGTGTAATDGTGSITIGLNAGTYTVIAVATSGTLWASTQITVTTAATQSFTITGTANTLSPAADPGACNVYDTTYGTDDSIKSGVVYSYKVIGRVTGSGFLALNNKVGTFTSSGTSANNMVMTFQRNSVVLICRGSVFQAQNAQQITIPDAGSATLPSLLQGNVLGSDTSTP